MILNTYAEKLINQSDQNEDGFTRKNELFVMDMVHNNPGLLPYESNYCDPQFLCSRGIAGKVFCFQDAAQFALLWDKFDPEIFPEGSEAQREVLLARDRIKDKYRKAKKAGLRIYFMMDVISLPARLVEKYADNLLTENKIDICKPFTKRIMDYLFDELFEVFPELDGLYIRYGENYVGPKYKMPLFRGNTPIIGNAIDYHCFLVNYLRSKVCVEKNREIMYRSWGGQDNVDAYIQITKRVKPHEKLYFCIKHTEGDFHRNARFNQQLNLGVHQQIVEVQCAREYEGKGAYPNYVGAGVINGFEELDAQRENGEKTCLRDVINIQESRVKGIWTWSRGGGWNGPYITGKNGTEKEAYPKNINGEVTIKNGSELWADLNAYVVTQWAKDTSKTDKYFVRKYARDVLGMNETDSSKLYELCVLSSRGVLLGRSYHKNCQIDCWWIRDQNINYNRLLNDVKRAVANGSDEAILREKAEAVQIWMEIVKIAESFDDHLSAKQYIVTTAKYGYYLFSIIEKMYLIIVKKVKKDPSYKLHEVEYEDLWRQWRDLYASNDCCPSLYVKEDRPMDLIGYSGNVGFDAVLREVNEV